MTALLHLCVHARRRRTGRKAAAGLGCECKASWVVVGNAAKEEKRKQGEATQLLAGSSQLK